MLYYIFPFIGHPNFCIYEISAKTSFHQSGDNLLGSAEPVAPMSIENGNIGDIAKVNGFKSVTLYGDELKGSESAWIFVIAHEFAHIVLRHNQMGLVLSSLH